MGKFIPDGLVGNDDLVPLLLGELLGGGVQLASDDIDGLVGFPLLDPSVSLPTPLPNLA